MAMDSKNQPLSPGDRIRIAKENLLATVISADQSSLGYNVLAQLPAEKGDEHPRFVPLHGSDCTKESLPVQLPAEKDDVQLHSPIFTKESE